MLAFVDTSVIIAISFEESGYQQQSRALGCFDKLLASTLLEAELMACLERERVRGRRPPVLDMMGWVHPPRRLTAEIDRVLAHGCLRGADLHHLATALYVFAQPSQCAYVTLDKRQAEVAAALGFKSPGEALRERPE